MTSHELLSPLTSTKGLVENLLEGVAGALPEKAVQCLRRMHANTDRIIRLTSMLLDRTRLDAGHLPLEPETVRLPEVLPHLLQGFEAAARKKAILLSADELTDVPVRADRRQLEQIFHNLIHEAIKHRPERGSVAVHSHQMDDGQAQTWMRHSVRSPGKSLVGFHQARRRCARGVASASPLSSSWWNSTAGASGLKASLAVGAASSCRCPVPHERTEQGVCTP